jgi:hypothetical protein
MVYGELGRLPLELQAKLRYVFGINLCQAKINYLANFINFFQPYTAVEAIYLSGLVMLN